MRYGVALAVGVAAGLAGAGRGADLMAVREVILQVALNAGHDSGAAAETTGAPPEAVVPPGAESGPPSAGKHAVKAKPVHGHVAAMTPSSITITVHHSGKASTGDESVTVAVTPSTRYEVVQGKTRQPAGADALTLGARVVAICLPGSPPVAEVLEIHRSTRGHHSTGRKPRR